MTTSQASSRPADAAAGAAATVLQFLRLAAGHEHYAVRVDAVREILEVGRMTPLPLMPGFVRGVMNLRGVVVPVIDLGARLGLAATEITRRTCVVIADVVTEAGENAQRLGMLVDAVFEVFESPAGQLEAVPRLGTRIDPAFIRSMVRVRGRATPELDIEAVLDPDVLVTLLRQHAEHLASVH